MILLYGTENPSCYDENLSYKLVSFAIKSKEVSQSFSNCIIADHPPFRIFPQGIKNLQNVIKGDYERSFDVKDVDITILAISNI